ncbi:MAG: tetratricopeptide repeat protein, partial [Alphaproteobacteria bacterium]
MIARSVVTILTVLLLGATLVYLLAPSPLQLAAMKAREGQYGEARTAYEELLAQRGRTRAIVLPLADIYVGAGEDELARELLRAYVQANPGDSVVAERFADLLGDNQFVDERIQVLRMIAENTDDVSVWRELEMLYDLRNLPDERTEALWEIAQGGDATLDEFNELARLLAARNDRERALAVSLRALRSRPNSITLDG